MVVSQFGLTDGAHVGDVGFVGLSPILTSCQSCASCQVVNFTRIVEQMPAGTIENVKQDAERAVRNQPKAHASWQFAWRNAKFRRAVGRIDVAIYSLDVKGFDDEQLDLLKELALLVVKVIEIHMSGLGEALRDTVDRQYFVNIVSRLRIAAEGLEQGLPADPSKRPSRTELLDRFANMLGREPLNLSDHTDCAPAGTS